jgi:hypothetical protein
MHISVAGCTCTGVLQETQPSPRATVITVEQFTVSSGEAGRGIADGDRDGGAPARGGGGAGAVAEAAGADGLLGLGGGGDDDGTLGSGAAGSKVQQEVLQQLSIAYTVVRGMYRHTAEAALELHQAFARHDRCGAGCSWPFTSSVFPGGHPL